MKITVLLARQIYKNVGKIGPDLKTRAFFGIMSMMQKKGFNPADAEYWKEKGWTKGKRPWK